MQLLIIVNYSNDNILGKQSPQLRFKQLAVSFDGSCLEEVNLLSIVDFGDPCNGHCKSLIVSGGAAVEEVFMKNYILKLFHFLVKNKMNKNGCFGVTDRETAIGPPFVPESFIFLKKKLIKNISR